jgi:gamma-glutamylputrescine oxidase
VSELPQPYWFDRSVVTREADVLVVGGGIVGLSTAYWAAKSGLDVLVLEGDRIGLGATGRSTGFLVTGSLIPFPALERSVGRKSALAWWELSRENAFRLREEILESAPGAVDWRPEGSWRTARAGSQLEAEWERTAVTLSAEGFAVGWRPSAETRAASGGEILGGSLFVDGDGGFDPLSLCRALVERGGFRVERGARVRHLTPDGDGVRAEWAGGGARARRLVLAVNAQIAPLAPGLADRVSPWSVQALATRPVAQRLPGLWVISGEDVTVRQLADGTVVAAGGGPSVRGGESGFLELPTAGGQAELEQRMRAVFPRLAGSVVSRWAGTVARTTTQLPLVGIHPDLPAVAYASGFGGQGLSLAFALGKRLADWLGDREPGLGTLFGSEVVMAGPEV